MQLRLRGSRRHAENAADLLVLVAFDVVQHEHRAGAVRQLLDGRLQVHAQVQVLRARRVRNLEHWLAVGEEPFAGGAERPEPLDDHVHRQAVEPRRKRRLTAKQGELLPRADKDVLRQLVGCVGAGHPSRQIEDARHMSPVYPFESRRIPLGRKDNVVHRHLVG